MNLKEFTYLLQHPQAITDEQTQAVKSLTDEFPYFQSARAIYLKGLKKESSFKYNQELKKTAAFTTDRSILFDYITSDTFIQNEISEFIKINSAHLKDIEVEVEDLSIHKSVITDEALEQQIKDTKETLDPILFEPKSTLSERNLIPDGSETKKDSPTAKAIPAPKDLLNIGKPLRFDKSETHSFNEWLQLTQHHPIDRSEHHKQLDISTPEPFNKEKKFELINKFIMDSPKITPSKTLSSKGNLAKAQMIQPESLMTETLARIYVEQKNYKKAIQSYKILSLKYPEKSSFFANQIKAILELQEQNNI